MGKSILETATKKGRPPKYKETLYCIYHDKEKRTAQNNYYAALALRRLNADPRDSFYISELGKLRRAGILEQVGRMYAARLADKDECRDLLQACKKDYLSGTKSKDIEKRLRALRIERANNAER